MLSAAQMRVEVVRHYIKKSENIVTANHFKSFVKWFYFVNTLGYPPKQSLFPTSNSPFIAKVSNIIIFFISLWVLKVSLLLNNIYIIIYKVIYFT
jgi:hypothetical protein